MADLNPFGDPEADNPFADASVRQITDTGAPTTSAVLDSYNPFKEGKGKSTGSSNDVIKSSPAVLPQTSPFASSTPAELRSPLFNNSESPPKYTQSGAQSVSSDFQQKQEELERKAEEIARREQELNRTQFNTRRNNFPPLPEKCCVHPCFYQDINLEIPLHFQKIVRYIFYLWMMYVGALVLNFVGALAYMSVSLGKNISNSSGATFGLSILWLILFVPCSFVCWFRPAYKAFRSDSSFNFFVFFFIFFCQFIATTVQAIGIDGMGSCGWLVAIAMVTQNAGAGVIMIIVAAVFTAIAVLDILMLIKVHAIYRSTGASFAKAQTEFRSDVMGSSLVQNAAADAAGSAARSAVQQQSGGNRF